MNNSVLPNIDVLVCPFCSAIFHEQERILVCDNGHTFDLAREGYVNFLRKKVISDTKQMVSARHEFLMQGYYFSLAQELQTLLRRYVASYNEDGSIIRLLDAGCGEGYYLQVLRSYLLALGWDVHGLGIDFSRDAIRLAAKKDKGSFFMVANLNEQLPIQDNAMCALVNIFAPHNVREYARVLSPSGLAIVVIPGPHHLQELRSLLHLLSIEQNKNEHVQEQFSPYFDLIDSSRVSYELHLDTINIERVVVMTPNYWHLTSTQQQMLQDMTDQTVSVEFICLVFRKRSL